MDIKTSVETSQVILWITTVLGFLIYLGLLVFAFHNIYHYVRKQTTSYILIVFYISIICVCCARCFCLCTIVSSLLSQSGAIMIFDRSYWFCREIIIGF